LRGLRGNGVLVVVIIVIRIGGGCAAAFRALGAIERLYRGFRGA
jgi:hypothetical protein